MDHKNRLVVPAEQRQRALTLLHALVQEARKREWTVTPVLSTMRHNSWNGTRTRIWPSDDFFTIDAGEEPAAIRLRMRQRRVDHVPTDDELERKERSGYSWYPRHDLVATDRLRLEVIAGSSRSFVVEDTAATRVEEKLTRAIDKIHALSDEAIVRKERQRLDAIAGAQAREEAEILRRRAMQYGSWVETLESLHMAVGKHRELSATVDELRASLPRFEGSDRFAGLEMYLEWAQKHLLESEPFEAIPLPAGDKPDLAYTEWRRWADRNPRWQLGRR